MHENCLKKQDEIKTLFSSSTTGEARYQKIIEVGKKLPHVPSNQKIPGNIVKGCQSTVYLVTEVKDGALYFQAESDALISSGLAALLVLVYSGESAETILTCPPKFIEELGLTAALTPNRANGLYSIHLRMKQEALKALSFRNNSH